VANCLPPLVPSIKDDAPDIVKKLLLILLESENYGERKGGKRVLRFLNGFHDSETSFVAHCRSSVWPCRDGQGVGDHIVQAA